MGKKPAPSLNFLKRRSKALNKDATAPNKEDRKSSASVDESQSFYYSDRAEKVKMAPIPTPPPSPPKAKLRAASKVSDPTLEIRSTSPPSKCASPPAVHHSPSPPASPKSEGIAAELEVMGESTLDKGIRLSAVVPEMVAPAGEVFSNGGEAKAAESKTSKNITADKGGGAAGGVCGGREERESGRGRS